jgi:threonine/homoserine/homoserine lactone efflux protein
MRLYAVAGFLLAVLPLVATPGASFTLLAQRVVSHGPRQAASVILGTATGLYIHAGMAAAGLSALVMRSSELFTALRVAGGVYLIALGLWTWRSRSHGSARAPTPAALPLGRRVRSSTYGHALLGNVLNPKAASIYLTLAPQFIDPRQPIVEQVMILATAQVLLITVWLLGWTAVIHRTAYTLQRTAFATVMRRVTSGVLVALGIRAVIASRP